MVTIQSVFLNSEHEKCLLQAKQYWLIMYKYMIYLCVVVNWLNLYCTHASACARVPRQLKGSIWGQEVEYSDPPCLPPLSICIPLEPTWFVTGIKDARKNCVLDPQETPNKKGV